MINTYIPIQPGFELNNEYYVSVKQVCFPYSQFIGLFYQYKRKRNLTDTISIIPDGCMDIEFYCHPHKPFARICGCLNQFLQQPVLTEYEYFGVRFLPSIGISNLNCSFKETINNQILLSEIIEDATNIVEIITRKETFGERVEAFMKIVRNNIFQFGTHSNIVQYTLNEILLSRGTIEMKNIAEKIGYSTRYIRKDFEKSVGVPPKLFSQIVRFQYSLNIMFEQKCLNIQDIISQSGYFDQAHFIYEFKRFTQETPARFMKRLRKSLQVKEV